jgi:hypothetical protein
MTPLRAVPRCGQTDALGAIVAIGFRHVVRLCGPVKLANQLSRHMIGIAYGRQYPRRRLSGDFLHGGENGRVKVTEDEIISRRR